MQAKPVVEVMLPSGEELPALGLGTWRFGEDAARREAEVRSLRLAIDIGYRVLDTAEMYGDGGAESVVGTALDGAMRAGVERGSLFVVSKVLPHNASANGVITACERSLRRLQLDHIDLYLLHWRGDIPLAETVQGFETLQRRGLVRHWGTSNFDLSDLHDLDAVPGGAACAANQVYYSLSERGVEVELLPAQRVRQMPLMAYSPIDQGALAGNLSLQSVAERRAATPAQVALAWLLAQGGVMALPKAQHAIHLRHNWAAARLQLTAEDKHELDVLFPAPRRKRSLAMR